MMMTVTALQATRQQLSGEKSWLGGKTLGLQHLVSTLGPNWSLLNPSTCSQTAAPLLKPKAVHLRASAALWAVWQWESKATMVCNVSLEVLGGVIFEKTSGAAKCLWGLGSIRIWMPLLAGPERRKAKSRRKRARRKTRKASYWVWGCWQKSIW